MLIFDWLWQNGMGCLKSVSTLLGLAVAVTGLWTFISSKREKEREQAYKIAAWWVRVDPQALLELDEKDCSSPVHDEKQYYVGIRLINNSDAPVYNVIVEGSAFKMKNGELIHPNEPIKTRLAISVLVPGDYISFAQDKYKHEKSEPLPWAYPESISSLVDKKIRPILNDPKWRVTSCYFTDAAGRKWCRNTGEKALINSRSFLSKSSYDYSPEQCEYSPYDQQICTGS